MKIFLLLFTFIMTSLNAQLLFLEADSLEREIIKNSIIEFYSKQLMQAKIFEDEKAAIEYATWESEQNELDTDKSFFYYHLNSTEGGVTQGYFVYSINKDQIGYLEAIYIDEEYRGQGLGKQILSYLETLLLEKDVHALRLYVFAHNKIAIELYKKFGFEVEMSYNAEDKLIGHHMQKSF